MDSNEVSAINERLETHETDLGITFRAQCPDCGEQIRVAEHQWWESICKCGRVWNLEINICADKEVYVDEGITNE